MSLVWQRHYSSYVGPAGAQAGLLGLGWRLPFEMHLQLCSDKTELFDTKNRVITFEALLPGAQAHSVAEGFWLLRGGSTWRTSESNVMSPAESCCFTVR